MSKIETLGALVEIELEDNSVSAGGIVLAGTAGGQFRTAKVISQGRGRINEQGNLVKPLVNEGERVVVNAAQVHEITVGALKLSLVNESAILAVIKQ